MDLKERLVSSRCDEPHRVALTEEIKQLSLRQSRYLDRANFQSIHSSDLRRLFELYDDRFLGGACQAALGKTPLSFRLSRRMTSAGGKTVREESVLQAGTRVKYEIVISTTLLFQTFYDVERPVIVTGRKCRDRFEALQRIFEHELVHLMEWMVWFDSHCTQQRFQSIADRLFGHREHTHQLITPRERAAARFGIRQGDLVEFTYEGRTLSGRVNRITKRATVLVESPDGAKYSDGRCYMKYYIPVSHLRRHPK